MMKALPTVMVGRWERRCHMEIRVKRMARPKDIHEPMRWMVPFQDSPVKGK